MHLLRAFALGRCLDALALLRYHNGDVRTAIDLQERALHLVAEHGAPDNWTKRLEQYNAALNR